MPLDGSGNYYYPLGTPGVPNQTLDSGKYNTFLDDLVLNDLNMPRPVSRGGTGASDAHGARINLDLEMASQTVTNYDSHVWESGSFWSQTTAIGGPAPGQIVTGFSVLVTDSTDWVTLLAIDHSTGNTFIRIKTAGTWGPWSQRLGSVAEADVRYVNVTGDTMSGDLTITRTVGNSPTVNLNRFGASETNVINGKTNNVASWQLSLPNASNQFAIGRYISGTYQDDPFVIDNSTGNATFDNAAEVKGVLSANGGIQISHSGPTIVMNSSGGMGAKTIAGFSNGTQNWSITLGNTPPNEFTIGMFNDSGAFLFDPVRIERTTGQILITREGAGSHPQPANMRFAISSVVPGISIRPSSDNCWAQAFENAAGTTVGNISVTATNTNYTTASDMALKEDLKSFDAGHIVDSTNVYDFKWKSTGERSYGIIAQQANEVYPAAVTRESAEMREETGREGWFIDYSKYVPVIMQELKALRARVAELEGKTDVGTRPT